MKMFIEKQKMCRLFFLLFIIIGLIGLLITFLNKHSPQFYMVDYMADKKDSTAIRILIVDEISYNKQQILNSAEHYFWTQINLDTLLLFPNYHMSFYRETKYLTRNFKEGNEYKPLFSHWDNTMDWRNHNDDRLCDISISIRPDGSGLYWYKIYKQGFFGFFTFCDKNIYIMISFDNIKEFYHKKETSLSFGEIDDIEKFGSMENVRDKAAPWGDILSYLTRPKDERGYDLSDMGVSDIFFQEAAEGFCSWFILQYMRGYKPFVTIMSKEIEIERKL